MEFAEFDEEQRRRLIDARQLYGVWRVANAELRHNRGTMHWRQVGDRTYLYHITGRVERSLGVRSPTTEGIKADHDRHRDHLKLRLRTIEARLREAAPLNRAAGIGRVPLMAARILRKLDEVGLLGRQLLVVGTHAMFAYEVAAGVLFEPRLTATTDIDLLWDVRRQLRLALVDIRTEGVVGLLRKVDRSFTTQRGSFRAVNNDGFLVDIIRPLKKDEVRVANPKIGGDDDLEPAAIAGLEWLVNAPKFERVAIGADGRPLLMSCPDPRAFALHKYWVSRQGNRDPLKRRRDAAQAKAVAAAVAQYLGLPFDAKQLSALPADLVRESAVLLGA
jgi:hypothetical protein